MPDLIARFQEKYPRICVHLSEGNSADLINRVRIRKQDLVVVARSEYGSDLRAVPFARAEFVLVARPDHPLATGNPVPIKSLDGEAMILRERGSGSRNAILQLLRRFDVTPSLLVESESLGFILGYIERKMGISFILSHEIERRTVPWGSKTHSASRRHHRFPERCRDSTKRAIVSCVGSFPGDFEEIRGKEPPSIDLHNTP